MGMKQNLHRACGNVSLYLKRSSPMILCCIAAVGVVGTAVAAAKATPKAMRFLEEAKAGEKELSRAEAVMAAAPAYIPAAAIGFGTVCCIFGANALGRHQQASLMSAYTLLNNYYKEYRGKLVDLYGEEADVEIRNTMAREHCNFHQLGLDEPDGKVIFYDEISGESILCYEREVMDAEYHLNRNFTMRGHAYLNEFYEFLGLPETKYGETVGWSMDTGLMWVDFEHRLIEKDDGGTPCYAIDMVFEPTVMEGW